MYLENVDEEKVSDDIEIKLRVAGAAPTGK